MFKRFKNYLILAPHQDDEVLGCGGLIQKILFEGSSITIVHATYSGDYKKFNKEAELYVTYEGDTRVEEMKNALNILNYFYSSQLRILPPLFDTLLHHKLDTISRAELITSFENVINDLKPDVVLIPAVSSNQDHEVVNLAFHAVMRPQFFNLSVIEYEINDEVKFKPNLYLELTLEEIERKVKSFKCYKSQSGSKHHMVSEDGIITKAKYRGKECFLSYAEAFRIIRIKS